MKNLYFKNQNQTHYEETAKINHNKQIDLLNKFIILLCLSLIINFSVFAQSLTLTSPNGGETWMSMTTQTISWQLDGGFEDLYLEYSIDNGTYWSYLAYVSAYDSISEITITSYMNESDSALLRISMYDNQNVSDESDGYFSILENPVYFYNPSAGEKIYEGVEIMLQWYPYSFDTVNIDFTADGGITWNTIATSHTETYLTWTTPTSVSDNCMIRVSDASDSSNYGLSPTFAIIDPPTASILSPNGGETWNYGSTATISWSGTNLPDYLYIEYSNDGGQSWDYIGYGYSEETGGSAEIYVPYDPTDSAKVRLVDAYYDLILDESDQVFTIYVPPVIMYYPYESQEFYIKDVTWISWLATNVTQVNIELSTDSGLNWVTVAENIDAESGWYEWTISGTPSSSCLIRVSDASDASKFGLSGQFTLLETPVITLNNPIGGEIWNTDSTYTISWSYDNPDAYYVYIDYSVDTGLTWNYLGYMVSENGGGNYEWKTPFFESDNYLIRIQDSYLDFVSDTSGFFAIKTFPATPICIVSVDSSTNQNVVIWEKPADDLIDSFIVYKESDEMDVYDPIGTISYTGESIFLDTNSNPAIKSYRYRLGFSDAAGNVYPMGPLHQTIHLAINKGVGDAWNLIWTDYLGIEVSTYNIYRSANGSNYEEIATISSSFTSYTDVEAPSGSVYYYIEVINQNGCNESARGISSSISNIATNNVLGIEDDFEDLLVSLYPNPSSSKIHLNIGPLDNPYWVQLTDMIGTVVGKKEVTDPRGNQTQMFDVSSLIPGIYFISIFDNKSSLTRKVVINR